MDTGRVIDVHLAMHRQHAVTWHTSARPPLLRTSHAEFRPAHPRDRPGSQRRQQRELRGQTYMGTKGEIGSCALRTGPHHYAPRAEELLV